MNQPEEPDVTSPQNQLTLRQLTDLLGNLSAYESDPSLGLIVLAAFGTAMPDTRAAGNAKLGAGPPNRLAVKLLDFYADTLAHVADRHQAGGSLKTAASLAVCVLRVRMRLPSHDDAKLRSARDRVKQLLSSLPPEVRAGVQSLVEQKPNPAKPELKIE